MKKSIFITGSESFVGRELIGHCLAQGIEVFGIDFAKTSDLSYHFLKGDITVSDLGEKIPEGVDAVMHLAALSRDQDCAGKAYECFSVNVMGTLNVMRAAKAKNAKQFMFASSEWVYEKFVGNEEKDEDAPIDIAGHTSEYALSKLVSEANLREEYKRGFIPTTIFRFAIIYGPRKTNWAAVESIMSSVKNKEEVTIGSRNNGRRFVHVSDIAEGIIKSIGLQGFNIINLSADRVITLGDIIEASEKILNKRVKVVESNPTVVSVRNPSNKRAKQLISWEPKIGIEDGLKTLLPFV